MKREIFQDSIDFRLWIDEESRKHNYEWAIMKELADIKEPKSYPAILLYEYYTCKNESVVIFYEWVEKAELL